MSDIRRAAACPTCGGTNVVDVMVYSSAGPIPQICTGCRASNRPEQPMHFRLWHGQPVDMIDPSWTMPEAKIQMVVGGVFEVEETWPPTLTVWCGPPADRPHPPTPEEILTAAGLRWVWAGDAV